MRIGLSIVAASLALFPTQALAVPRYLFVDMRGDGAYAQFIDLNSIKQHGEKFDYWLLQVNLATTATRPQFISHTLRQYTDDCATSTSQMTYAAIYTATGEPLSRGAVNAQPGPVVPETVGDELQDLLCRGKTPSYAVVGTVDEARALGRKLLPELKKH
jgi:hypothetical protein